MSRLIPEAEIERVKRSTDLVALIRSRGIELRQHGTKDLVGRCPFHADGQTPNLIVSPEKGLWHCMACGRRAMPSSLSPSVGWASPRLQLLRRGAAFAQPRTGIACPAPPPH
jgi:hypothetical protein